MFEHAAAADGQPEVPPPRFQFERAIDEECVEAMLTWLESAPPARSPKAPRGDQASGFCFDRSIGDAAVESLLRAARQAAARPAA